MVWATSRGIIAHLDHLVALGIDIRLAVADLSVTAGRQRLRHQRLPDIDPAFGTLAARWLLAAVHERGMKLVMDLVVNHTSDEHPWFVESALERDNAKRDWYWWRPARPGTEPGRREPSPPTGSRTSPVRCGSSTRRRGEYYLHLFSRKQPDLNWENPQVRAAVYEMMRWWLDRGIDGFRMDVINMLSKDADLPDGRRRRGVAVRRRLAVLHQRPADPRVRRRDAPRGARRVRRSPADGGGDARPRPSSRRACSPTPHAASSTWCSSSSTSASTSAPASGTVCPSPSRA